MSKMADTLWHVIDIESEQEKLVDIYWILSGLFIQVEKLQKEVTRLQECTYSLLEREDIELHKHLVKIDALYNLPYDTWFYSCFAGVICNGSIAKYIYVYHKLSHCTIICNFITYFNIGNIARNVLKYLFIIEYGIK